MADGMNESDGTTSASLTPEIDVLYVEGCFRKQGNVSEDEARELVRGLSAPRIMELERAGRLGQVEAVRLMVAQAIANRQDQQEQM